MAVCVLYHTYFASEMVRALREAGAASDPDGQDKLRSLLFDYFDAELGEMEQAQLEEYLMNARVWRVSNGLHVYKTGDVPCIAFAARADATNIVLVALGVCYRYPTTAEAWWTNCICPRMVSV
jgi:hypothetical protein